MFRDDDDDVILPFSSMRVIYGKIPKIGCDSLGTPNVADIKF